MGIEQIIQYCKEHYPQESITQIALKLNLDRHKLSSLMKEAGIEIRKNGRIYIFDENYFQDINTEEKAYWLGFLAADGNICKRTIKINLNIRDKEHLIKFSKAIKSNLMIKEIPGTGYGEGTIIASLEINSIKMVNDLIRQGVIPNKSLILKPPTLPECLVRHWIRGYLDGDGSIIPKLANGNAQLSFVGTKEVLRWIEYNLTHENTHTLYSRNKKDIKNTYQLSFGGTISIINYIDYLYKNATIFLDRKYQKVLELKSRFKK